MFEGANPGFGTNARGSREGEAPAEPFSWATSSGRRGLAGASPSLIGSVIDSPQTGIPYRLKENHKPMESERRIFGSSVYARNHSQRLQ